ncbi:MAG TPA: hydrogenase maturation protease [Anaerolineae bacterium]|nr:hydrogenase maturation protease [Anaerolineae bacterium]HQH37725.1 hydrogenase maturation protease [Anaerolineae bacterium]
MEGNEDRTLIVGFGNLYRRDDGVARVIINTLLARWGRALLDDLDDGFEALGHAVDGVVLHQLVPELAETVKDYAMVIFVDAHVGGNEIEPLHEERLDVSYHTPFVYHQTHPSTLLALAQQMYGTAPEAWLLSVQGYDFDFGEGLSPETAALVEPAVARILARVAARREA